MQKIVVNGDYLALKTFAGVGRFAEETMKKIDAMIPGSGMEFAILTPEYAARNVRYKNIKLVKQGHASLNIWKNTTLPRYVLKQKAILVDFTQAFPMGVKSITYIHDCIPEKFANSYETKVKRYIHRPIKLLQRKYAAKHCLKLMTLTENSKKDIISCYHVPQEKVVVSYTGWEHIINTVEDDAIFAKLENIKKGQYCFTIGSRVWHKNLKWVLSAAKQNPQYKFVISGDNRFLANFEELKNNVPENVVFTGYISDGEVRALMANCKAFLFPTLYEGFGMPPMEALATNAPIIISNTSCMPEIYEDTAHYINPLKYDEISIDAILQESVAESNKVLEKYSWEKTAAILFRTIKECAKSE